MACGLLDRGGTLEMHIGRWILNNWTTRKSHECNFLDQFDVRKWLNEVPDLKNFSDNLRRNLENF